MPELPEVQRVVETLKPLLKGARIVQCEVLRSDILTPDGLNLSECCVGRSVLDLERRGKRIVWRLDDGNAFYIHLGMTGRLCWCEPGELLPPHTHLLLTVAPRGRPRRPLNVRFTDPRRFGGIWWLGTNPCDDGMGPEPLTLRTAQLAIRLRATRRIVKSALLDQTLVAGLGNIYVDEALHHAGIHPQRLCCDLDTDEIARLNRAIKQVLRRALRHKGSTLRNYVDADGTPGDFQRFHRVYDRTGQSCLTCGSPIERLVLGGRSSHFCPRCQPQQSKLNRPGASTRPTSGR